MPASSNFNQAIREAQTRAIVGPNVVQKALPYVGGGMALTAFGALGGLTLSQSTIYGPLFMVAIIAQLVLFFVASSAANNANNTKALPLLATYSLLTGFTLSGIIAYAALTIGVGSIATAALATGITFIIASYTGQRMSDNVGQALSGVVGLGLIGLVIAMVVQIIGSIFISGGMVLTSLGVSGYFTNSNKPWAFPASFINCLNCRIGFVFYSHKCCK